MKKLFFVLIIMVGLFTSCDVNEIRRECKNYITAKENSELPVRIQNYSIKDENVVSIKIDSISLFYINETDLKPLSGYISTKWQLKREFSLDKPMFSDEYMSNNYDYMSDFEYDYKTYLVPLKNFDSKIDYKAEWPSDNPFKK